MRTEGFDQSARCAADNVAHRRLGDTLRATAPDVYRCRFSGWDVYLDLRRDRYFCIARESAVARGEETQQANATPIESSRFIAPARDLELSHWAATQRSSARGAARLLWGALRVAVELECQSLAKIVVRLRSRRLALAPSCPGDLESLQQRMAEFQSLRPWIPHRYRCLFDSLAAAEFLSTFGWCPALVFGVQAEPFHAHCWLQEEDIVVNDSLDRVCSYSPILVV